MVATSPLYKNFRSISYLKDGPAGQWGRYNLCQWAQAVELTRSRRNEDAAQEDLFGHRTPKRARRAPSLPLEDNTPEGLQALLAANRHYREIPWPEPFNRTTHHVHLGDARDLSWITDGAVQ